jgi:hypothetical protein
MALTRDSITASARHPSRVLAFRVDDSILRKAEASAGVLLTLTVVWLHYLVATSAGPLWRDEAGGVGVATLPTVGDVWANLRHDSFPILWPLALREYSALFGLMNDPAFRVLGFFVGAGVVAALWFSAIALRHSVPLLSLALLAMNSSLIVWGDSMRAYGFGILVILLAGAWLWRFVEEPGAGRFAAAAVAAILSVNVLYYNSVLVLAFCAGGVAVCALEQKWKRAALVVLVGALAAMSLIPYAAMIHDATNVRMLGQISHYDLAWFREKLDETLRPGGSWVRNVWVGLFALSVIVGVRAVRLPGQLRMSQRDRAVALFSLVALVVGVVGTYVFLHELSYYTQPWYYLTLLAIAGVCIDALFGAVIHTPALRIARLALALLLAGATLLPTTREVQKRMSNVDLVAARLNEIALPGDVVLVNAWFYGISFSRYYHGQASWMTVPPIGSHRFHRDDLVRKMMMMPDQAAPVRLVTDRATAALRDGYRVFIVGGVVFPAGVQPPIPLPAAPFPGEEPWHEGRYLEQWTLMLGYFLQQHSIKLAALPVAVPSAVNKFENVPLLVAEGWRP